MHFPPVISFVDRVLPTILKSGKLNTVYSGLAEMKAVNRGLASVFVITANTYSLKKSNSI